MQKNELDEIRGKQAVPGQPTVLSFVSESSQLIGAGPAQYKNGTDRAHTRQKTASNRAFVLSIPYIAVARTAGVPILSEISDPTDMHLFGSCYIT